LGINLESGKYHCWVCGAKGGPAKVLAALTGLSYGLAQSEIEEHRAIQPDTTPVPVRTTAKPINMSGLSIKLPPAYQKYLVNRGFSPRKISTEYGIRAGGVTGFFAYRIIVPIYFGGSIVNLVGRDISGKQIRYKALPNSKAVMDLKQCLYGIDSFGGKSAIIVEGIFDKWRMGKETLATLGTEVTDAQIALLYVLNLESVFVLFDAGAESRALNLAHRVSAFVPKVEILHIQAKDPACLTSGQATELKREIGIIPTY
jgi:DNA primase